MKLREIDPRIGVSTANCYPFKTEKALETVLGLGFKTIEVFLNAGCEADEDFAVYLRKMADNAGARIVSVHSFTSFYEPFMLFTNYERRLQDGIKCYKKVYKASKILGADYVIMHGDREKGSLSKEASISRYKRIADLGKEYGITLLLENVVYFRSADLDYIETMVKTLGDAANFVFDVKQNLRSNADFDTVMNIMGKAIKHVHISDNDLENDCLLPGKGNMNFVKFFTRMADSGYKGSYVIELYRRNFNKFEELYDGAKYLEKALN